MASTRQHPYICISVTVFRIYRFLKTKCLPKWYLGMLNIADIKFVQIPIISSLYQMSTNVLYTNMLAIFWHYIHNIANIVINIDQKWQMNICFHYHFRQLFNFCRYICKNCENIHKKLSNNNKFLQIFCEDICKCW